MHQKYIKLLLIIVHLLQLIEMDVVFYKNI